MYQDFIDWISSSGINFFIEAEARESRMNRFISEYNSKYTPMVNIDSDGICVLGEVDKWGIELRIYLNDTSGMPVNWQNRKYRNNLYHKDEFSFRIDDNALVKELFNNGFKLGYN